jgi:hypothetical protein
MIYRILILLFILSGCNKYYGVKDSIYVPTGEIKYLNKTKFEISKEKIINLEAKNFENSNIFTLPSGNLKTKKTQKLKKLFNHKTISNFLYLNKKIIYISKDSSINSFEDNQNTVIGKIPKLKIKNNSFRIIKDREAIYALSDNGILYLIDKMWTSNIFYNFNRKVNFISSNNNNMLFSALDGELITINKTNKSHKIINKLNINFGYKTKDYNVNVYKNFLFYSHNSNTFILLDRNNYTVLDQYIIENINIMSSIGDILELSNTPLMFEENLIVGDTNGKIVSFNFFKNNIDWQIDLSQKIISYFIYSNSVAIITSNEIIFLELTSGKLIKKFNHNISSPTSHAITNGNLLVQGDNIIKSFDISSNQNENILNINIKNKKIDDIGYSAGSIFFKNYKSLYLLSE